MFFVFCIQIDGIFCEKLKKGYHLPSGRPGGAGLRPAPTPLPSDMQSNGHRNGVFGQSRFCDFLLYP